MVINILVGYYDKRLLGFLMMHLLQILLVKMSAFVFICIKKVSKTFF